MDPRPGGPGATGRTGGPGMTGMPGRMGRNATLPPDAQVVASYPDYAMAQRAVDSLSDARFPVQYVTIVGTDLRLVEAVVGRLSWGRAALGGAGGGAWFGLLIGLFLAIFAVNTDRSDLALILWALLWGVIAGALFGLVAYAFTGGERDFLSQSQLAAAHYDVYVAGGFAEQARNLLGGPPAGPPRAPGTPGAPAPPSREPAPETGYPPADR